MSYTNNGSNYDDAGVLVSPKSDREEANGNVQPTVVKPQRNKRQNRWMQAASLTRGTDSNEAIPTGIPEAVPVDPGVEQFIQRTSNTSIQCDSIFGEQQPIFGQFTSWFLAGNSRSSRGGGK
jgi:hypothetical protein